MSNDTIENNTGTGTSTSNKHQPDDDDLNTDERTLRQLMKLDKSYKDNADTINLHDITILNLSNCQLTTLPYCIATLLPNLSILFCSNNSFVEMPLVIGLCTNLQMIAFKSCSMKTIHPDSLQKQLRWLILTDNEINEIPDTIGNCINLQKCMLSGNQITKLPNSIVNCQKLELIRLASNQLLEPPLTLLSRIPSLKWIALSDNPFINNYIDQQNILSTISELPIIDNNVSFKNGMNEDVGEILGQGAGGITRKIQFIDGTYGAIKRTNTTTGTTTKMTSDGLPEQERMINCAIAAAIAKKKQFNDELDNNTFQAFIKVLGQTSASHSLVMEYLDNYVTIAKTPSFTSCTRDVYDDENRNELFSLVNSINSSNNSHNGILSMITDLLNALVLIHSIGICHGDFYGHNILIQKHSHLRNVRLSDYGAAFFYDHSSTSTYGKYIEQIELRSFFVFIEELYEQYHYFGKNTTTCTGSQRQQQSSSSLTALLPTMTLLQTFFTNGIESCHTFEQVKVYWNQLKLQMIATEFDSNDFHHERIAAGAAEATVFTTETKQEETKMAQ